MNNTSGHDPRSDKGLNAMMDLFREENYFRRLKHMFRGLHAPRDTRDYKFARIELQRLAAPTAALLVPMLAVMLLVVLAVGRVAKDEVIVDWRKQSDQPVPPLETPIEKPQVDPLTPTTDTVLIDPVAPVDITSLVPEPPPEGVHAPKSPEKVNIPAGVPNGPGVGDDPYGLRKPGKHPPSGPMGPHPDNNTALLRALRWLKKNQQPDGSWPRHQAAMTGLAVLTFLAHGEKPAQSPEFGETVRRGIDYLLKTQDERGFYPGNYEGLIATYALCEAAGMTKNPNVRQAAEKAVAFIIAGQHSSGGFDYGMKPGERDDTSVMGWAVQALKAAQIAQLRVDGLDQALKLAVRGFRKNAAANGGFGYIEPGQSGLTGVGTLAFQMMNAAEAPEVQKSLKLMDDWKVSWSAPVVPGGSPQYYFYYATQVMYHAGGARWKRWNEMMKATYLDAQKILPRAIEDADGNLQDIGWWENGDQHTDRPVMDTCLAALQLMVYIRYLPTFQPPVAPPPAIDTARGDLRDVPVHSGAL
jgi:hypothetical protein